jgi:pyruvate,water dikinase
VDISPDRRGIPYLEDEEVKEMARYAKRVEDFYKCPQDIAWAVDWQKPFPFNIYVLQSRPETVWGQQKRGSILGEKSVYELLMEKAMSRVKISS